MNPYDEQFVINRVGPEILVAYKSVNRIPGDDSSYCVWPARIQFDIDSGMSPENSLAKHLIELRDALGIIKPFPSPPTRDQIIHVSGNFLNLLDDDNIPIWDAFIDYLIINDINRANKWISILRGAGTTHINLDISGDYNENLGWAPRYPIPGSDWTNDLNSFSKILDYVITNGFIPIIHLAADGQGFDPVGKTYGWQWGMDNVPNIIRSLSRYIPYCLWNTGWDGCFPDWTPDQTVQFLRMLRNVLGDSGAIATEFGGPGTVGYCHMGNGSSDWQNNQLDILDAFFVECMTYPNDINGVQQTAARLLGPAKRNISPANDGPYYLSGISKSVGICYFETCAYQFIRREITSFECLGQAAIGQKYGFSDFGQGLPE